MKCRTDIRSNLIQDAKAIVASVEDAGYALAGACVVSSLAAGDFTPVSDVDMLLIAADNEGRPGIIRRLYKDRVFEWMVLPNSDLRNVNEILADAGLCHDILDIVILIDTNGWLHQMQQDVTCRYQEPNWKWQRISGQLQRTNRAIEQMRRHLMAGNILQAQRAHVSVLKALFAIPRAVLNERCTMARGLMFCRESALKLGWSGYIADVLALFGVTEISEKQVFTLQSIAAEIINVTEFTKTEKAIRTWFLQSSHWLLENAGPADAVWPLYFWSSSTVEEASGSQNPILWETWSKFAAVLSVDSGELLWDKVDQAERLYESAVVLTEPCRW